MAAARGLPEPRRSQTPRLHWRSATLWPAPFQGSRMNTRSAPATVASVDLSRYLGTWFEIARLPMRHEPEDFTDITAHYSLQDDGKVRVRNRALDGKG